MSRLSYFMKRAVRIDWKRMRETTRVLEKRSGKSRAWLMKDMLDCALKYNAGYVDYKIAEMYKLNEAQRKTVITRGISNNIVRRMNDKAYWHFFDDKTQFNQLFSEYVHRKWVLINEQTTLESLEDITKGNTQLIGKPLEGSSGQGILKFTEEDWKDGAAAFKQLLIDKGIGILEEMVVQHHLMAEMCPTSVNTCRIATLLGDKQQGIVYAFLRIGNGKVMDNVDCGGMAARIDLDSGMLKTVGADKQGNTFEKHPMTGTPIVGFTIPHWEEAKKMCLDAAQKVPQMRFVAWDVAITEDGPTFIEGNSFPSHAIPQFAAHYPDGIGILPEFEKFIDL
jgi:glutathione synthase/RimK-type ligase-like ATP-grasp enzyme